MESSNLLKNPNNFRQDNSYTSRIAEVSPCGRYYRFFEKTSSNDFTEVFGGVDTASGGEVSWNHVFLPWLTHLQLSDLNTRLWNLISLRHPKLIHLYTSWIDSRTLVFICEKVPGMNMREFLVRNGRPSLRTIKSWGLDVLSALSFLHSQRPAILYKDLKLECLFVTNNEVKLGHYAISKIIQDLSLDAMGSPEYMAPEAFETDYDSKVDVYSFGICLLEIATALHPYKECKNSLSIVNRIQAGVPPGSFHTLADEQLKSMLLECWKDAPIRPSASLLMDHSFFFTGVRLDKPPAMYDLEVIEEVDESLSDVDFLDYDTIEISIIIKFSKDQLKEVSFPFSLKLDQPMEVAREMVRELNLDPMFAISISHIIEQKMGHAKHGTRTTKAMRSYSDSSARPVRAKEGFLNKPRWSLGDLKLSPNEDKRNSTQADIVIDASPLFK